MELSALMAAWLSESITMPAVLICMFRIVNTAARIAKTSARQPYSHTNSQRVRNYTSNYYTVQYRAVGETLYRIAFPDFNRGKETCKIYSFDHLKIIQDSCITNPSLMLLFSRAVSSPTLSHYSEGTFNKDRVVGDVHEPSDYNKG